MATAAKRIKTEYTASEEDRRVIDELSRALKGARDNAKCCLWTETVATTTGMYSLPPTLQEMRRDCTLTDVTLLVGPDKVTMAAHRVILAAFSEHFKETFSGESVQGRVVVDFADPASMKMVLDYFYTRLPISLTKENVAKFLLLAKRLRSKDLEIECSNFIKKFTNVQNCVKLLQLADQQKLIQLLNGCALFVVANLEKVAGSNMDFAGLSMDILLQLIGHAAAVISDKTPAENEKQLFMLVWNRLALLSEAERREEIPKLLEAIHLPQADKEFLAYVEEKVVDLPAAKELLIKARKPINPAEKEYWYMPRCRAKGTVKLTENPEPLVFNEVETKVFSPCILIRGYPWRVYVEKTEDKNVFHLECTEKIESLGLPGKVVAEALYKPTKKGAGEKIQVGPNIYHNYTVEKKPTETSVSSCENLKLTITVKFEGSGGQELLYSRI